MKKKVLNIIMSVLCVSSIIVFAFSTWGLAKSIKFSHYTHFVQDTYNYKNIAIYSGSQDIIIFSILVVLSVLIASGLTLLLLYFNRADISELTKSSVQAYRDRKAARQEAKRQKKIQQAKDTIAELEDKEKDGE